LQIYEPVSECRGTFPKSTAANGPIKTYQQPLAKFLQKNVRTSTHERRYQHRLQLTSFGGKKPSARWLERRQTALMPAHLYGNPAVLENNIP
jgi:hypothetical protein